MVIEYLDLIIVILSGLTVGFLGGYGGIAGAPIIISFLVVFGILNQHNAQGTVLAAMLGPMSLFAVIHLREEVKKHYQIIIIGVIGYAIFSYFGAKLAFLFDDLTMQIVFVSFLIFISINQLSSSLLTNLKKISIEPSTFSVVVATAIVGFMGGLMGIGAGVLLMPILLYFFKYSGDDARAISLAILLPPVSLGGSYVYFKEESINFEYAIIIFFSYLAFNGIGSKVASSHSPKDFEKNIGYIYIILVIAYLFLIYQTNFS